MKSKLLIILSTALMAFPLLAGDLVVVVHLENPLTTITKDNLASIYTGKKSSWKKGGKIKAYDQKFDSEIAKEFIEEKIGKTINDYQAYWMEKMLSGESTPPKSLGSDVEVIETVSKNKGGIGYIDSDNLTDKVKKIEIKD